MASEFCQVNTLVLSFQVFILEADKLTDFLASVMVAVYFCTLHYLNNQTVYPLFKIEVTRFIGYLSIIFVILRLLDYCYC